jgi:hypothetical protein
MCIICIIFISSIAFTGAKLPDKAMFPQTSIPQDFLYQLYDCASMFKNLQVSEYVISDMRVLVKHTVSFFRTEVSAEDGDVMFLQNVGVL